MSMKDHVTVVGILRIALAVLGLLGATIVFVAVVGGGLISGDADAIRITAILGPLIAGFVAVLSLPGLIAGIGLLRRWSWARWLALILAVPSLFNVPIGTLFSAYTIWTLMQDETAQMFA